MKTEEEIRKVVKKLVEELTEHKLPEMSVSLEFDQISIIRTLRWVLGEDDVYLDYLLKS